MATYHGPLTADTRRQVFGRGGGRGLVDLAISGDAEILATLKRLGNTPSRKLLHNAMRKGGNVVVKQARANLRSTGLGETGMLSRSLGVRVRTYPHSATVVGIVGPRRGARWGHRARLLHLLEFSHRMFVWGKDAKKMTQPNPFLTSAWSAKRREAMDIVAGVLAADVRREAAKMGVKFG